MRNLGFRSSVYFEFGKSVELKRTEIRNEKLQPIPKNPGLLSGFYGVSTMKPVLLWGDRGQPHLSREQRFALQKAFLRQIRGGFPRGFYRLSDTKQPWHTGTSQGQLFHRPCIFHVAAPMNRYIAPLKKQLFLL